MVEDEILIFSNDLFFWKKINLSAITQVSSQVSTGITELTYPVLSFRKVPSLYTDLLHYFL